MGIKIITGQAVRGNNFFPRNKIVNRLWKRIESGSSILISAPRRVGKTSLMEYIQDNPKNNYHIIYLITESVNSEEEYYKKLWREVIENIKNANKFSNKAKGFIKNIIDKTSTTIGIPDIAQVTLNTAGSLNYHQEFLDLLISLDLENHKLIIMVDEFPQTLENIINDKSKKAAIHFLETNRELRQNTKINEKVQFIYAGSIGLENIVSEINSVNLINDLDSFKIEPLNDSEAKELISQLIEDLEFKLNDDIIENIIKRIKWLIPYYIQLVISETSDIYDDSEPETIDDDLIEKAFKQMLEKRNYFEHWISRLRKAFNGNDFTFAKDLLNEISLKDSISSSDILNLATGLNVEQHYKNILMALEYDGYINRDDNNVFRFNSPILKMWWAKNVAY